MPVYFTLRVTLTCSVKKVALAYAAKIRVRNNSGKRYALTPSKEACATLINISPAPILAGIDTEKFWFGMFPVAASNFG